ncbi:helix-turn-helix domain-containing protein [Tsukamurella tyrosinosolvens]|uniref:helix-turn-helix domain-containing protein n=1 Tax=Tsukamurella tyrosinosolvens TaxID=57704 RepID=UPI001CE0566F|nr:helix-turn-helix domain-containing protein [Tsukamurella tyrosinosolvens]MCA4995233.1 helix-turn-helix domain-containing protein [Tsukamurella tyrosinosolvens]
MELARKYSKKGHLRDRFAALDSLVAKSTPRPQRPQPKRHPKQHLTPEQVSGLVARYNAGTPSTQLVAETGMAKGTILKLLHANGATIRRQGLSPEDITHAAHLYASGQSLAQIGSRYGVSHTTVRYALIDEGIQLRPRRGWPQ